MAQHYCIDPKYCGGRAVDLLASPCNCIYARGRGTVQFCWTTDTGRKEKGVAPEMVTPYRASAARSWILFAISCNSLWLAFRATGIRLFEPARRTSDLGRPAYSDYGDRSRLKNGGQILRALLGH